MCTAFVSNASRAANYGSSQTTPAGQVSEVDPLANSDGCTRDIPYFKELDVNVLRVYQVNSSLDHTSCMNALEQAGIYVLVDLATQIEAISGSSPTSDSDAWASTSIWTSVSPRREVSSESEDVWKEVSKL